LCFRIELLLLFYVKLLPNVFRDVIVSVQREAFLNVPDQILESIGVQFVMLLSNRILPAIGF
jgi:hypothetical protein